MFSIPNSPKDLAQWLMKRGFTKNVSDALVANQVGGETLARFTRADLMDIFPDNFLVRKKLWDFLEDMRHQEQENFQKDVSSSMLDSLSTKLDSDHSNEETQQSSERSYSLKRSFSSTESSINGMHKRKGSSSMSTLSVSSDASEKCRSSEMSDQVDDKSGEPVPKLKRTHAFCERKPDISKDESEFNKKFVFPISKEVNLANKANQQLPEKVRNRFLRECLTCLQAAATEKNGNIKRNEFEMAAKKICKCLPIFKDVQPPGWPLTKEFPFWSTVKCQLRQRYHNTNYLQRKSETTTKKKQHNVAEDDDTELHHQEIIKELKRKSINYKAIKELQQMSFENRRNAIEDFSGKDVVKSVLEKYPFYKNEIVLLNELELHVARLTKVQTADTDVFKGNFLKLQPYIAACDYDIVGPVAADDDDDDIHPGEILEAIQNISQLKQPFLLFIPEDVVDLEYFIRNANISTAPVLTALETERTTQLFIIIDKEIKLSLKTKDYINGLLVLLSVFYTFNIAYDQDKVNCFKFLEKHILGINPKKNNGFFKSTGKQNLSKLK